MLNEALRRRRAASIGEVVEIMTALEGALSRQDGVWWFNRLYLRVTLAVRGAVRDAAWTNAEVLWALRQMPALRDAFFARLDGLTGFAGRGLLLAPAQLRARGGA
jgi:hypothetical protein